MKHSQNVIEKTQEERKDRRLDKNKVCFKVLHFNAGEQSQGDKGRKKQGEPVGMGREE